MPVRTSALSLDRLRRDGEACTEELSREYYLALAGYKTAPVLQPIYAKYAALSSPEALALTREAFQAATDPEDRRRARTLFGWVVGKVTERELAPLEEHTLAWEGSATVRVAGETLQFERLSIEMANETDRPRRMAVYEARNALMQSELSPLRQELLQREREIIEGLGIAEGYIATWEELTGVDTEMLTHQCESFLAKSQAVWDDTFPDVVRSRLAIDPRDATRADALALFRAHDFDSYFPAREMEERIQKQVREMNIDPFADGRIILDTEEREGKRARAFCSPVRVPQEVYLVLRPHGGQMDWSTFLHELGHSLHYAYVRPDFPFEYRHLGDNSITEGYAMLFDGLMEDRGWLARYSDLGPTRTVEFLRSAAFQKLHYLRRYCAKFLYEMRLYGDIPWSALPELYIELLGTSTNFSYSPSEAFVDVDAAFYSASYLRAWQLQAILTETLRERFDEDWWRNPRAGPWVVQELLGEGQRELAHELAARVTGRELSFGPLVEQIERLLA